MIGGLDGRDLGIHPSFGDRRKVLCGLELIVGADDHPLRLFVRSSYERVEHLEHWCYDEPLLQDVRSHRQGNVSAEAVASEYQRTQRIA